MQSIAEFLMGTAGLVIGGVLALLLIGWFILWRSRRKLRQTT